MFYYALFMFAYLKIKNQLNSMEKLIIPVSGMHCRSCEMLIEEHLSRIKGVKKSKASFKKGTAEIHFSGLRPTDEEFEEAIRAAGYSVGAQEKKELFSKNTSDYKDLGIAFIFLLGIYFILKNFGLTNLNIGNFGANSTGLSIVFLVGLTAGISTCMALVGGLVLGISARHAEKHPEATTMQKFRPHLYFNLGRVAGFSFLGGILGSVGSIFNFSGLTLGVITIAVSLVMIIVGLQLTEIFPALNKIKLTLPKFISQKLGIKKHEGEYSHLSSAILGASTFFLPCGFTQAMQLYAVSTGNFLSGASVMGIFALGTVPGLLGVGGLTSFVKGIFAKRFFKFAGLLVIFFAIFNISNGFNLTGFQLGSASLIADNSATDPNVTLENGYQIVKMTQLSNGYSPNKFTVQKGIPVKWIIDSQDPFSCAGSIVMSKFNIQKRLQHGENTIEFTPTDTGALKFSCSMGMYTGVFNVVDGQGNGASQVASNSAPTTPSGTCGAGGGGGCGGCGGSGKPVVPSQGATENKSGDVSGSQAQIVKTTYTLSKDIQPNTFTVKSGVPVKLIVDVKEDGQGCMSSIMVQGLYNKPQGLEKGKPLEMDFTPIQKGEYNITCAMGVPRGKIIVN